MENTDLQNQTIDFLLYTFPGGEIKVEVYLQDETLWLSQKNIAELFGVGISVISRHIDNIYVEGELDRNSTVSKMERVQNEGNRKVVRQIDFYNLDVIIAVGYRVNSSKATQFRIWATNTLGIYYKVIYNGGGQIEKWSVFWKRLFQRIA